MGTPLKNVVDRLMYQMLQAIPPEAAHDLGKWAMRHRLMAPGPVTLEDSAAPRLFGQRLPNPLGLAAGFDKNAQIVDAAIDYGFGFVEVGSVTYRGGPGNPKPRMFRLDQQTIMNRMGLNGDPAEVVAGRLRRVRSPYFAVNIAKTHSPDILGDAAIEDICGSFKLLQNFGIYTAINVSCPNTREGRTFEDPAPLKELLSALSAIRGASASGRVVAPAHKETPPGKDSPGEVARPASARPLLVKLSPVLDPGEATGKSRLEQVLAVCENAEIDGYICCNTLPVDHPKFGKGGVSGHVIRFKAWRMCQFIAEQIKRPVIGCGGIYLPEDLDGYMKRGCAAVQVYNGFVRGPIAGTRFAHRLLENQRSSKAVAER